jgi:ketosteroid isomerase-like protein
MTKFKSIFLTAFMLFGFASLHAQTLKADDQLAIQNALSQWNQLQDDGNVSGFMNLWTSDAVFENPFGKFSGKDGIKQFVDGYVSGFGKGKRHQRSNVTISGSGENTTVVEDMNVVEVNEIPYIAATVRLNAMLVKEGGQWKFKSVKLVIDPGFNKLMEKMKSGK